MGGGYIGCSCTISVAPCDSIIISKLKFKKYISSDIMENSKGGHSKISPSNETISKLAKKMTESTFVEFWILIKYLHQPGKWLMNFN